MFKTRITPESCQICSCLDISPEDPDGCLVDRVEFGKLDVQRPDAVVLGDRQSPQCSIQGPSCACDLTLIQKKLAVIQPYPRHL